MQISKQTFEILKNFSEINSGILIKPGTILETISTMKNILATAEISEEFETEFAIYDLPEFLNLATDEVFLGAEYTFTGEDWITLDKDKAQSKYFCADANSIVVPSKAITMPSVDVTFDFLQKDLDIAKRASGILSKFDLAIKSVDNDIALSVQDKKEIGSNTFDLVVGSNDTGAKFTLYFKVENLKLMDGDYHVEISSEGISHFKHANLPVEYWIALEPDSEYEA